MTRQAIIEHTLNAINLLPEDKAQEISDFADIIIRRHEEHRLTEGMQQLSSESHTFDFLNNDEDLYSQADIKEAYNG